MAGMPPVAVWVSVLPCASPFPSTVGDMAPLCQEFQFWLGEGSVAGQQGSAVASVRCVGSSVWLLEGCRQALALWPGHFCRQQPGVGELAVPGSSSLEGSLAGRYAGGFFCAKNSSVFSCEAFRNQCRGQGAVSQALPAWWQPCFFGFSFLHSFPRRDSQSSLFFIPSFFPLTRLSAAVTCWPWSTAERTQPLSGSAVWRRLRPRSMSGKSSPGPLGVCEGGHATWTTGRHGSGLSIPAQTA